MRLGTSSHQIDDDIKQEQPQLQNTEQKDGDDLLVGPIRQLIF
jgi:hypothetical protein